MTLADIFEYLTYGELSQLKIGNLNPKASESKPSEEDYALIMSHINMALKAVYKRFFLSSREMIVQIYDHIQIYTLDRRWAVTNHDSKEKPKYIVDSPLDPFLDDLLKIEQVFNEGGEEMFLNDLTEPWSVFTPRYNQVQIPFPEKHNSMVIHYRASHPTLKYTKDMKPEHIEVLLPEAMLEPVLFYIAHRIFAGMNDDMNQEGNNYLQKYEQSCQQLEKLGLQITPHYGNLRLDNKGWV